VIFCLFLKEDVELYRERMPIIFPTTRVEKGARSEEGSVEKEEEESEDQAKL